MRGTVSRVPASRFAICLCTTGREAPSKNDVDSSVDFWSLKPSQLSAECRVLADTNDARVAAPLREEAARLATEWYQALGMRLDNAFEESRRAALIAALRRRTIEILIKASRNE